MVWREGHPGHVSRLSGTRKLSVGRGGEHRVHHARCNAFGHFDIQYASLGSGMSIVVGILDGADAVIASDGCAGNPCDSRYVLKTVRIGSGLCLGMTGDTDFMREILRAMGLSIPATVADEEIFWHIEETGQAISDGFGEVWERLGCEFSRARQRILESRYAVTAVLVGFCDGTVLHSQWDEGNCWFQAQWNTIALTAGFNVGRAAANQDELSALYGILETTRGTHQAEARLVDAIRYWSQCDSATTVGRNVFVRRLSENLALRYSLDPLVEHSDAILARLEGSGAVRI